MSRIFNSNNAYYLDQPIKKETQKEIEKLFDKKDVFSWANCEEAKKYIGEEGYFRDDYQEDLACWSKGLLQDVDSSMPVDCTFENETNNVYGLFLPADKVKQQEPKKWRPFKNIDEFCTCTHKKLNSEITYRDKMTNDTFHAVITRITISNNAIDMGAHTYSLYNLFRYYELYNDWTSDHFGWQPFGVEE